MLFFEVIFFAGLANSFYTHNRPSRKEQIVGGNNTKILEVPYQAALFRESQFSCGGSIILSDWIITAAHCLYKKEASNYVNVDPKNFTIVTGASTLKSKRIKQKPIESFVIHEDYDPITQNNDIALIKLKEPLIFNKRRQPIKLSNNSPKVGDEVTVSGYGKEYSLEQEIKADLKIATIKIHDHNICDLINGNDESVTEKMLCAGGEELVDTCQGDSGGPLVYKNRLAGIVSWGLGCGLPKIPGIYTRVDLYIDWVQDIINIYGTSDSVTQLS